MIRQFAWTLTAALALAACGAGDRKSEQERPVTNPTARPSPVEAAAAGNSPSAPQAAPGQAATSPQPATEEVHPSERLYTVQIASYLSPDSARSLADKLTQRGFPVWTMEVRVGERTFHRIRVGAHPNLGEMRKLGTQISSQFKQQVWVAPVDMSARIPVSTVAETRALLARQ